MSSERGRCGAPSNTPNGIAIDVESVMFPSFWNVCSPYVNAARPCLGASSVVVGETMSRPLLQIRKTDSRRAASAATQGFLLR